MLLVSHFIVYVVYAYLFFIFYLILVKLQNDDNNGDNRNDNDNGADDINGKSDRCNSINSTSCSPMIVESSQPKLIKMVGKRRASSLKHMQSNS